MLSLTILDVGHGTSMVLQSVEEVVVIDAGRRTTLLEYLTQCGVRRIDRVFVSHADADHLDGLTQLMLDNTFEIREVFVNADATKDTDSWDEFRRSFGKRKRVGSQPKIHSIKSDTDIPVATPQMRIEVLAPAPEEWLGAPGGKSLGGKAMDSNSLSAVVRVLYRDHDLLLAGGDAGRLAFDTLLQDGKSIHAEVLAFPHHGGRPGRTNMQAFGELVARLVDPCWVVFSTGRGSYGTPQPDIIRGVRKAAPHAHIACTQLSKRCANKLLKAAPTHLVNIPAMGRVAGTCCAGSMMWTIDDDGIEVYPRLDEHDAFISVAAESALCRT